MAIKDWKKVRTHPMSNVWKKNNDKIELAKMHSSEKRLRGWVVTKPYSIKSKIFKTRLAALKFTKAYMKKK